jgi:DNA helicase HerA-like ATPase
MNEAGELGILVGVSKPDEVTFESRRPVSVGEYVILKYGRGKVLGLVERSAISSDALGNGIRNYEEASESRMVAQANRHDKSYKGYVRILGYLDELKKCKAIIPALPPEPGTEVVEATAADLREIFAPEGPQWLRIGTLLRNTEVETRINVDKIVARHLAILAMTGMGKSNLVSMLAKEISKVNGTMVIFDYHDDYSTLDMGRYINLMPAKINPRMLPPDKLAEVIEVQENASNQIHVLREALSEDVRQRKDEDFWDELADGVRAVGAAEKMYREAAAKVEDKIEYVRKKFSNVLDPGMSDPLALIKNGKINIINLVELTEKQANVAVSYYLEELLDDRKRATRHTKSKSPSQQDLKTPPRFTAPVLVVIEEAHIFIPKDEKTETKYFASKVAREGRKFGLGLVIVSQRPRSIDANILSQMGSLAVMRMIQHDDQAQVSAASEALSRDLINQLPSLNPGEAVFAGQWVNLPTFVKADEVRERKIGGDQKAVEQWSQLAVAKELSREASDSYVPPGYIQD